MSQEEEMFFPKNKEKNCFNCGRYPECSVWSTGDLIDTKTGKPYHERVSPEKHPACGLWGEKIQKSKPVRLNLGCGDRLLEDYINIDKICPHEENLSFYTFKYGDVRLLAGFENNSVDEIYASHVLDHLSRNEELDEALSNWYRVLKPGGILRVAVSDFEKVSKMYQEGMDLERLWGHIVGGHKTQYDRHGCVFDFKTLRKYLEIHGFVDIKRYRWQDFLPEGFDDLSRAYIPHLCFDGILMSLNVICMKVILPEYK